MESNEWLKSLAAGDEVFATSSGFSRGEVPAKGQVAKTNKTQIVVNFGHYEKRFSSRDGRLIGGDRWSFSCLVQATDELREQVAVVQLHRKAKRLLENVVVPKDRASIEALIAVIEPFVTK